MENTDLAKSLNEMLFEEKIKLLSETEKAYVRGYIEKAMIDCQKARMAEQRKQKSHLTPAWVPGAHGK
ncbi:hypothetical protein AGMMS49587_09680 [Spirochaetia bacterium]|nr:hypothetical protein AGMMS49587_09680 [Spirochaetia bacterium]